MAFHIVRNNIIHMKVDAIVNSANPKPTYAYGTDFAIYTAAGAEKMLLERKKIGDIVPSDAIETGAGSLKATYVIHTVAPLWKGGEYQEFDILRKCYDSSLKRARELNCKSIAFPLLATGIYGFPKDKALEIAMSAIQMFLLQHQMDVFLVVFDEKSFVLSGRIFNRIQSYVDANYITDIGEEEYVHISGFSQSHEITSDARLRYDTMRALARNGNLQKVVSEFRTNGYESEIEAFSVQELSFQEKLFQYIDHSGMKASEIYKQIGMSRQQYSRMQCNTAYQPKKNTALLLSVVLRLSVVETEDLLSRAGYAFNPSSKQDLIVKACMINGQYDLYIIDAMLQKNGLDTLIDYEGKRA